ncbi:MAG: cation transporter, partial [Paucibacter sp.]|nr:cation transporter [Roseateles sp.]
MTNIQKDRSIQGCTSCETAPAAPESESNPHLALFSISNMDCRSEERAIRERLSHLPDVRDLVFDLKERRLSVSHSLPSAEPILAALHEIGMNASLAGEEQGSEAACSNTAAASCSPCETKVSDLAGSKASCSSQSA